MPIYEYKCKVCSHQFEVMQSISELYAECPVCHVSSTNRLISVSNFALKGSGWYADGYSSPNKKLPEE